MLKEFKEFIARGNVMDLAVGVIIGAAFTAIVKSLVSDLINPLIGIFLGKIDLSNLVFSIGSAHFRYGSFLNEVINFLIIHRLRGLLDGQGDQQGNAKEGRRSGRRGPVQGRRIPWPNCRIAEEAR